MTWRAMTAGPYCVRGDVRRRRAGRWRRARSAWLVRSLVLVTSGSRRMSGWDFAAAATALAWPADVSGTAVAPRPASPPNLAGMPAALRPPQSGSDGLLLGRGEGALDSVENVGRQSDRAEPSAKDQGVAPQFLVRGIHGVKKGGLSVGSCACGRGCDVRATLRQSESETFILDRVPTVFKSIREEDIGRRSRAARTLHARPSRLSRVVEVMPQLGPLALMWARAAGGAAPPPPPPPPPPHAPTSPPSLSPVPAPPPPPGAPALGDEPGGGSGSRGSESEPAALLMDEAHEDGAEYERAREENIARNREIMKSLGIDSMVANAGLCSLHLTILPVQLTRSFFEVKHQAPDDLPDNGYRDKTTEAELKRGRRVRP